MIECIQSIRWKAFLFTASARSEAYSLSRLGNQSLRRGQLIGACALAEYERGTDDSRKNKNAQTKGRNEPA